jgi:hypothetical protein
MDQIQKDDIGWIRHFPLLRHQTVGHTLYHELGHHIHTLHRPEYGGRENVADKWSRRLFRGFVRHRYPYLIPVFWVLHYTVFPIQRRSLPGKVQANDRAFREKSR